MKYQILKKIFSLSLERYSAKGSFSLYTILVKFCIL